MFNKSMCSAGQLVKNKMNTFKTVTIQWFVGIDFTASFLSDGGFFFAPALRFLFRAVMRERQGPAALRNCQGSSIACSAY